YQELQRVYALLGAKEKVGIFASHLPHDLDFFHRRETYGWFNQWLGKPEAGIEEAEFDASPQGSLNCTSTGQVLTSLGGRSVVQVNIDRARQMMPGSPFRDGSPDATGVRQKIRAELIQLLALPKQRSPLRPKVLSSNQRSSVMIEEFQFESEPGVRLTGWFVTPSPAGTPRPTVLYLSDDGGDDIVAEPGSMERLLASGHAVCAITLRGLGIATPRFPKAGPRFYDSGRDMTERFAWASLALGLPVIGQRVWDTLRAFDYLASRPDVVSSQIRVLGRESAGLAAVMAAGLDGRPRSVLLDQTVVSYASILESEEYSLELGWFVPGILRKFDLPDLVVALSPRPCWVLNGVDPNGGILPETSVREQYARKMSTEAFMSKSVRFLVKTERDAQDSYLQWLANT
ncbi:MAG: hypothetical protein ACRD2O_10170, partial [Terriglobia bacterium]